MSNYSPSELRQMLKDSERYFKAEKKRAQREATARRTQEQVWARELAKEKLEKEKAVAEFCLPGVLVEYDQKGQTLVLTLQGRSICISAAGGDETTFLRIEE